MTTVRTSHVGQKQATIQTENNKRPFDPNDREAVMAAFFNGSLDADINPSVNEDDPEGLSSLDFYVPKECGRGPRYRVMRAFKDRRKKTFNVQDPRNSRKLRKSEDGSYVFKKGCLKKFSDLTGQSKPVAMAKLIAFAKANDLPRLIMMANKNDLPDLCRLANQAQGKYRRLKIAA